jgi:signal transduction histidine kinase
MTFRQRLGLFLIVTLIAVQALTAVLAYSVVRSKLVAQGESELAATSAALMRQLDVMSERVSDDVYLLSLDYALRKAVAERDQNTLLSALRNHGNRIGATRMMVVGFDGKIEADTRHPEAVDTAFPFRDLLDAAAAGDKGTALAVLDRGIYWIVVVPVRAPVPIAFIVAAVPVDDALLEKLRELSPVRRSLALATPDGNESWALMTKTRDYIGNVALSTLAVPSSSGIAGTAEQRGNQLIMVTRLTTAEGSAPIIAVLAYPLNEALGAYRAVIGPVLIVLGAALAIALAGAMLIARGVSRPLEALAAAARRIAHGDYTPLAPLGRRDEIGELSLSLNGMVSAVADRELKLKDAISSLEIARNDAVAANEAKSQFLSNMSHELRTPLNAVIGFSEMMCREAMGPLVPRTYLEYAGHIHASGMSLLRQVQEMLDLSDAEAGRLTLERGRCNFGDLLNQALTTLGDYARAQKVIVSLAAAPSEWPPIEGDADRLLQSITNLIHNAVKFSPREGQVTIRASAHADHLLVRIADKGIGIRAEDIELVMRPFHRRNPAFEGRHQGAGLGLPFAKAIVELHGGELSLKSAPGVGTTVTILLPLAATAALAGAA